MLSTLHSESEPGVLRRCYLTIPAPMNIPKKIRKATPTVLTYKTVAIISDESPQGDPERPGHMGSRTVAHDRESSSRR
jgi:hypothetical protein